MLDITKLKNGTKIKIPNRGTFEVVDNRLEKGKWGPTGNLIVKDEDGKQRVWDVDMIKTFGEIVKAFEVKMLQERAGIKRKK